MELKQLNRLWGPVEWKTTRLVTRIGTYSGEEQHIQVIIELRRRETCLDHVIKHQDDIVQVPEWKQVCRKHPDVFFLVTQRKFSKNRRGRVQIESPLQM